MPTITNQHKPSIDQKLHVQNTEQWMSQADSLARRVGAASMAAILIVWTASALAILDVSLPAQHTTTIIWAAVALLLGYDIRQALIGNVGALKPPQGENDDKSGQSDNQGRDNGG